jgi:hypothetical protein
VAAKRKPARKPERKARVVASSRARRRRAVSGSVARSLLDQAPQTTQQNAAGFMKPVGTDSFEPAPPTTVRPVPATGVADPERAPGRATPGLRRARRARGT